MSLQNVFIIKHRSSGGPYFFADTRSQLIYQVTWYPAWYEIN